MRNEELLQSILDAYDSLPYPEEFLAEYDIMECLSEQKGVCTFLVQNAEGKDCVAKCYEKKVWGIAKNGILETLDHQGLPKHIANYENEDTIVTVREYIEGVPLGRMAKEKDLSEQEIVQICIRLCDILEYLHHRKEPVIHRDIKPQNIIVRPDGSIALIDFDIARVFRSENEADTMFFGTVAYAPPEQYGYSQTDCRTDIYSFGIVLRWLLTGSTKENQNIKVYRPLAKIIRKCTAFSPKERYSDISQVKKELLAANPRSQRLHAALLSLCGIAAAAILIFAGVKIYQKVTYTPFTKEAIPAYLSDEERATDAVSYMKEKYGTSMFEEMGEYATVGDLRRALIDLYGLDRDYVNGMNDGIPRESDAFFLPWEWDNEQHVDREPMIYAAVKVHEPSIVEDWSSIKDDNGYYPGLRVAVAFAEKTGITTGMNRPSDLTKGEMALVFANADRVFEAAKEKDDR